MILHGADQSLSGHCQKTLLEVASQGDRPLHQRCDLIQQFRLDHRHAAQPSRRRFDLSANYSAALAEISDDLALFRQLPGIVSRRRQADRLWTVETMAVSQPVGLNTENRGWNHFITKQQHCPMHRTDKLIVAVTPAHPFGDWQTSQGADHDAGNQISRGSARLKVNMNQPCTLVGLLPLQIANGDAAGTGETFGSLARFPIRAERSAHRRATPLHPAIGLADRQALNQHRQSARGREATQIVTRQSGFLQAQLNPLLKGQRQTGQRLRRQFFSTDFNQQIASVGVRHGLAPGLVAPPPGGRTSGNHAQRGHRNRLGRPPWPKREPARYSVDAQ